MGWAPEARHWLPGTAAAPTAPPPPPGRLFIDTTQTSPANPSFPEAQAALGLCKAAEAWHSGAGNPAKALPKQCSFLPVAGPVVRLIPTVLHPPPELPLHQKDKLESHGLLLALRKNKVRHQERPYVAREMLVYLGTVGARRSRSFSPQLSRETLAKFLGLSWALVSPALGCKEESVCL